MSFTLQDPMLTPAPAPLPQTPATEGTAEPAPATTAAVATHDPVSLSLVTSQNNRLIEKAINGAMCRRGLSANQTLTTGADTTINLDTTTFDTAEMASGSGIVIATPGIYSVSGTITYATNTTGGRLAAIQLNGAFGIHIWAAPSPTFDTHVFTGDTLQLDEGDTLTLVAMQLSGGDLAALADQCVLAAHLIAPT